MRIGSGRRNAVSARGARGLAAMVAIALFAAAPAVAAAQSTPAAGTPEAVALETPTGTLHGTLILPTTKGPHPVALIISGSGPTDRDGNTAVIPGENNSLALLAEGLAERGIASLRYDKRGVAESAPAGPDEADLRFDTYVEDAAAWIELLRDDARFSSLTVIGHSEGSLIGMIAARRAGADGFVSLAGVGRPASAVLLDQLRPQLSPALFASAEAVVDTLAAGTLPDSVPPTLFALFRPSVQPYLISWFRYDPAQEIARLEIPVLIAQGTTDIQVGVEDARTLARANPAAELRIIDGMNHVLKAVPADRAAQLSSYGDPTLPVVPELIDAVAAFVHGIR